MFCPQCGFQLPDDSAVCSSCGHQLRASAPEQSAPKPVEKQPPASPKGPAVLPASRMKGGLILVTLALSLILVVVSVVLPLTNDFAEIPFMRLVIKVADGEEDLDELRDDLEYAVNRFEDELEFYEDEMDSDEEELAERFLESMEELSDKFSLLNFRRLVRTMEDIAEELDSYDALFYDLDDIEDIIPVINVIFRVVIGIFALPLVFTLLGGLRKSMGWTITALVFLVIPQVVLCGFLWVVLSMVVYITQAVLCRKLKKAKIQASV